LFADYPFKPPKVCGRARSRSQDAVVAFKAVAAELGACDAAVAVLLLHAAVAATPLCVKLDKKPDIIACDAFVFTRLAVSSSCRAAQAWGPLVGWVRSLIMCGLRCI
jgi:hypothetical protein